MLNITSERKSFSIRSEDVVQIEHGSCDVGSNDMVQPTLAQITLVQKTPDPARHRKIENAFIKNGKLKLMSSIKLTIT